MEETGATPHCDVMKKGCEWEGSEVTAGRKGMVDPLLFGVYIV